MLLLIFQSVEFNHIKMMVVGFGGRGKTTLLKQLMRQEVTGPNVATIGVLVKEWK